MENHIILGLETSCDETSVAVVRNGKEILSNVISSQIDLHKIYGGVVPEIASRKHLEYVIPAIDEAVKEAGISLEEISAVGVTAGPGLVGALLVGVSAAKSISFALDKPLIGINHIEAHIMVNLIENSIEYPFISLVVSGGHSHIVLVKNYNDFTILGKTRDDAAGEAFDKVSRCLGLGYPGGPIIDKKAKEGNENFEDFPKTYFKDSYDFSFSGIKTAVMNYLNKLSMKEEKIEIENVCASFQHAVVKVLVDNSIKAAKDNGIKKICLAGGVAANSKLRMELKNKGMLENIEIFYPRPILCTDNAVMIASLAYHKFIGKDFCDLTLNATPNLKIGQNTCG